jgi:hypothetical protein
VREEGRLDFPWTVGRYPVFGFGKERRERVRTGPGGAPVVTRVTAKTRVAFSVVRGSDQTCRVMSCRVARTGGSPSQARSQPVSRGPRIGKKSGAVASGEWRVVRSVSSRVKRLGVVLPLSLRAAAGRFGEERALG